MNVCTRKLADIKYVSHKLEKFSHEKRLSGLERTAVEDTQAGRREVVKQHGGGDVRPLRKDA